MHDVTKRLFVYSVYQPGRSQADNFKAYQEELNYLSKDAVIPFTEAKGVWKGVEEPSIVLSLPNTSEYFVNNRARIHNQEAYLKVYDDGAAELTWLNAKPEAIGQWTEVTEAEAFNVDHTQIGSRFYIVKRG